MKKEDAIKYALIAVGAYLVYKWLTQPGGFLDPNKSAAAQIPGDTTGTTANKIAEQTTQTNQTTQQTTQQSTTPAAPAAPTQKSIDEAEYGGGLSTVQAATRTGYTTQQLTVIEAWFTNAAKMYQAKNGNMNGFNGYIASSLPDYLKIVAASSPSEEKLRAAALESAKATLTGDHKLTGHQWNWYRAQAAIAAGIFDAAKHSPSVDGLDASMTAAEYHALLAKNGLGGMSLGWSAPVGYGGWAN